MNSKILLGLEEPLAVLLLMIVLVETPAFALTPMPDDCVNRTCGHHTIHYPFWIDGLQKSYCGYTPFKLRCINQIGTPVLSVLELEFYVNHIFYENESILVTSSFFANNNPCPFLLLNFTTNNLFPLALSSSNKKIVFFYNCSGSKNRLSYQNMSCDGDTFYFGGESDGRDRLSLPDEACKLKNFSVAGNSPITIKGDYMALLKNGWLLNWTAPSCSECRDSGGQCGYNETEANFMCICRGKISLKRCDYSRLRITKTNKTVLAGVAASAGFIVLLCAILFFFSRWKNRPRNSISSKFLFRGGSSQKEAEMDVHLQTHLFSYDELMEATNYFDTSQELGDGGFGTVYKGKLRDGRTVAIKRLYDRNYRQLEQFTNEVEILSRLRHQNLVNLYGCTSYRSRELLLVYEYISNGTVADHLHGSHATERILTWLMRLNIAIETADALAYLHAIDPPIIHRDVKTTNILLDGSFHVKVADFGLSRLFPLDATHVSTAPQGTPGYVDPEYHQCFQLTDKSDVYSFGVVLVELISSKPAIDTNRKKSEINLAYMAISKIQNHELDDLVDPELWNQSSEETKTMITMVAELAFRCLQSDGDMRPPIKEVLEVLRAIENTASYKVNKKEMAETWTHDDAGLISNVAVFSPNTVAGMWVSRSTPNTSQ